MRLARLGPLVSAAIGSPWVVFLVALLVRLIVAGQLLASPGEHVFYLKAEPARIAWALVSGHGFSSPWPNTPLAPTAQQPPVYPLLLAAIFAVTGAYSFTSLCIAVGLDAIFSALTAVAILHLGKRYFGLWTGVLAGWIWACWIYAVVVSLRLWESSLSGLLLAAGLLLLGKLSEGTRLRHWLLFGALAGIAALTNTTLLAVFFCFWLWLWAVRRDHDRSFAMKGSASVLVCLLVLLPWTVRNYVTFHRFIPIRDNFGLELWIGNHEGVTYLYDFHGSFPLSDPTEYNRLGEIAFMETMRNTALQFIAHHPRQFLLLCGQRFVYFWTTPRFELWLPISLLAWLGAGLALWRKGLAAVPCAIVLAVFPLVYYVTHPWSTYRHPIEPVMILLLAYAVVSGAGLFLAGRRRFTW